MGFPLRNFKNADLRGLAGTPGSCAATWSSNLLLSFHRKREMNHIKFSKGKCKVPHMRTNNHRHLCILNRLHWLENFRTVPFRRKL